MLQKSSIYSHVNAETSCPPRRRPAQRRVLFLLHKTFVYKSDEIPVKSYHGIRPAVSDATWGCFPNLGSQVLCEASPLQHLQLPARPVPFEAPKGQVAWPGELVLQWVLCDNRLSHASLQFHDFTLGMAWFVGKPLEAPESSWENMVLEHIWMSLMNWAAKAAKAPSQRNRWSP